MLGYVVTQQTFSQWMNAIAAPIRSSIDQRVTGTVSIAGPFVRLTEERMVQLAPLLLAATKELGQLTPSVRPQGGASGASRARTFSFEFAAQPLRAGEDERAQFAIDDRIDAEPGLEAGPGLVQAAWRARRPCAGWRRALAPARASRAVRRRCRRRRARPWRAKVERQRLRARHAERGGVDQEVAAFERPCALFPSGHLQPRQGGGDAFGAVAAAVGERHRRAGLQQGRADRPRSAACAEHQHVRATGRDPRPRRGRP
jgi:hypothetical protein